ncbi:MAG: hypothetical protein ABI054_12870 [Planctomycetota bacterium]
MKLSLLWTRVLTIALLCALAVIPGAMHARVCLVALGAVESSACCSVKTCCNQSPSETPSLNAADSDCHCCLDVDLDSGDRTPIATPASNAHLATLPAWSTTSVALCPPPPARNSARNVQARAGPRPRMAAPLPLRI